VIFLVDNYDSFTYNLVQAIGAVDPDIEVARNDAFEVAEVLARRPDRIVVSPGPGRPEDAGRSIALIRAAEEGGIPVLGVCLGHQAIAAAHGARVDRAPKLMHGKTSEIHHDGRAIFSGLAQPFEATRYHSLCAVDGTLPAELVVTARSEDGVVMGVRHRQRPVFGVQFHPESILTAEGPKLIANFIAGVF
jgi:anthranilate synthase/aminodeoxychorismate synthase-like glutamine amidotransferase